MGRRKPTMVGRKVHLCTCPMCQCEGHSTVKRQHEQVNLFMSTLNPQQWRWYGAVEAGRLGHGGIAIVSRVTCRG